MALNKTYPLIKRTLKIVGLRRTFRGMEPNAKSNQNSGVQVKIVAGA